ncbi:MarR family winged helix-turn-helix transcriptional regulator [Pedobacter sp. Hv1]|uniref:MarR family winged helix-turn-helix transcriptional regulator n=1 Tax=Pedobacter sp. Hv1 TaxID=1740090 RepID=UPI0006D8CF47|nr:MarR family transcriptional regulator [Pedobacter sp. Hv1]KQB99066.1 MarR family transcriptional regulator [Pedobacter sp. Hv1]
MNTNLISVENRYNLLTGRLFMYINRYIAQKFKSSSVALTREQWTILVQLWKQDGVSQQVIADETGRDKPSTTRLLDNLERDGYLERKPAAEDRRLNLIFLTKKGKVVEQGVMEVANQALDDITAGLTAAEMETVKKVFEKIYKNISK